MKSNIFKTLQNTSQRLFFCTLALGLFAVPTFAQSEDEDEEEVTVAKKQPQKEKLVNYPTVTVKNASRDSRQCARITALSALVSKVQWLNMLQFPRKILCVSATT